MNFLKSLFKPLQSEKADLVIRIIIYAVTAFMTAGIAYYFGIIFGISFGVISCGISYLILKRKFRFRELPLILYFVSILLAIFPAKYLTFYIQAAKLYDAGIWKVYINIITALYLTLFIWDILAVIVYSIKNIIKSKSMIWEILIPVAFNLLTAFIILPGITMLTNSEDYSFSIYTLIKCNALYFLIFAGVIIVLAGLFIKNGKNYMIPLLHGILTAFYIQYMFLNVNIQSINGASFKFSEHIIFTIFDLAVWATVITAFVIFYVKLGDKFRTFSLFISTSIVIMLLAALVSDWIKAPENAFSERLYYYAADEQFTVAGGDNVIVFVLDAVDNQYIKTILSEEPSVFDDYRDFTLYTNTCSLYSLTNESMPQMFTGADFNKDIEYGAFYNRLHENGYKVNFYGYTESVNATNINSYLDNYVALEFNTNMSGNRRINVGSIAFNSIRLSFFQLLPDIMKAVTSPQNIDFTSQVYFESGDRINVRECYENREFLEHLKLTVNKDYEHYLIMEHIDGAHEPVPDDDYIKETIFCFGVVQEYIRQLKQLDLYDNSTIIITADHGTHTSSKNSEIIGSTPLFMIKKPFDNHENIQITNAPEYHTDFLKTILECIGLYNEEDGDRFGSSVFDFKDGDLRERTWYNRGGNKKFAAYTYTGTDEDLFEQILNDNYTEYL